MQETDDDTGFIEEILCENIANGDFATFIQLFEHTHPITVWRYYAMRKAVNYIERNS